MTSTSQDTLPGAYGRAASVLTAPPTPAAPVAESSLVPRQIDALTGLRALAAWHVVLFHVGGCFSPYLPAAAQRFLDDGESAVCLFFVLSGFVLAYVYLGGTNPGRLNLGRFYWARFARIYPLYFCSVLVAAPLAIAAIGSSDENAALRTIKCTAALLANVTLVQSWHPRLVYTWNLPAWSLSAEAFFYLTFPLLARVSARFVKSLGLTAAAGIAVYAVSLVLPQLAYAAVPDNMNVSAIAKFNPAVRLPEFVLGMLVGQAFLRYRWQNSADLRRLRVASVALATLIVVLKCTPAVFPFTHPNSHGLLYGLLIWTLAHPTGWLDRLLASRTLVLLGEASYATYLLHLPLWLYWKQLCSAGQSSPSVASTSLFLAGLLIISLGAFVCIERPARSWLRQYGPARSVPSAP